MTAAMPDPREPKLCPRCSAACTFDGWGHVHPNGVGIGSCPVPDPRFRDQLAKAAELREQVVEAMSWAETLDSGRIGREGATALLDRYLAAEVEARVQAAEQRELEIVTRVKAIPTYTLTNDDEPLGTVVLADDVLAALASPAPAPHAEEG